MVKKKKKKVCFTALTGIVHFSITYDQKCKLHSSTWTPPPPKKTPSKNLDCHKNIKIITILIGFFNLYFVVCFFFKCFNLLEYQKGFCLPKGQKQQEIAQVPLQPCA